METIIGRINLSSKQVAISPWFVQTVSKTILTSSSQRFTQLTLRFPLTKTHIIKFHFQNYSICLLLKTHRMCRANNRFYSSCWPLAHIEFLSSVKKDQAIFRLTVFSFQAGTLYLIPHQIQSECQLLFKSVIDYLLQDADFIFLRLLWWTLIVWWSIWWGICLSSSLRTVGVKQIANLFWQYVDRTLTNMMVVFFSWTYISVPAAETSCTYQRGSRSWN